MVEPGFLQQSERTESGQWEHPREGFGIIVKVYQCAFTKSGFNITI